MRGSRTGNFVYDCSLLRNRFVALVLAPRLLGVDVLLIVIPYLLVDVGFRTESEEFGLDERNQASSNIKHQASSNLRTES